MRTLSIALTVLAMALVGTAGAAEYVVVIDKMKFGPVPAELHPGDVIIWQNKDIFRHTATTRDKAFDFDLPARAEARMEIGAPGRIDVYCRFHPGMTTTLVIGP